MNTDLLLQHSSLAATALVKSFCLILIAQMSLAQAPSTISHQGLLTDPGGSPVADDDYSATFSIYDVPTSGSPLWGQKKVLTTVNGIFNIELGPITGVNFHQDLWLGLQIGSDPEMTDRTKLTSVPSAFGLVMPFEDILVADGFEYTVKDTQWVSIAGNAFHPEVFDDTTAWEGGAFLDHGFQNDYAVAPVTLPHGAIISTFSCTIHDADVGGNLRCSLCTRTSTSACATNLKTVASTGSGGVATYTGGVAQIVDNEDKSYIVRVWPIEPPSNTNYEWSSAGEDLEIVGATIKLLVDGPH